MRWGIRLAPTGAILMTKLLSEMEWRGFRYGLVPLCIEGGQGMSSSVGNLRI